MVWPPSPAEVLQQQAPEYRELGTVPSLVSRTLGPAAGEGVGSLVALPGPY